MNRSIFRRGAYRSAMLALAVTALPLTAQEVVQALPAEGTAQLNSALQRLARDSGDVSALLDAGEAALALRDIPAAIGFFGRAKDISPSNPRVTLGLANAYTMSRRPVEALLLFAEAERAGVARARMAEQRGLAFDLVGDAASAQEQYRIALAQGENASVRRSLALNQAILGDRAGFEATLLPLLQEGDNAAFRTRAFGLAVLGDTEAAVQIAKDMMQPRMASRVEPYLRYMPRLTSAQQAAAGNLGVFPRTAAIGRDDPAIAAYDRSAVRRADASLAPQGPVMGSQLERARARQQPSEEPASAKPARRSETSSTPAFSRSVTSRRAEAVQTPTPGPAATPTPTPVPAPAPAMARAEQPRPQGELAPVNSAPVNSAPLNSAPVRDAPVVVASVPVAAPAAQTRPAPQVSSVADAFSDFNLAQTTASPSAGAVDITRIAAPREVAAPPPPAHPARHWVQVATGRDIKALGFDWRRISRQSEAALTGKGPFVTPWGEANRLLSGPYESRDAARAMVNRLQELGIDSFPFSSDEGQEILPLD